MESKKVIGIVGSTRDGNNKAIVESILSAIEENGISTELIHLKKGVYNIEVCDGCDGCQETGKCVIDDDMNMLNERILNSSGLVIGAPTMFSGMAGNLKVFLDRTNPLCEKLTGKKVAIVTTGCLSEEEGSVQKATETIKSYCNDMEMEIVGNLEFYNLEGPEDVKKDLDRYQLDISNLAERIID